MTSQPKHYELVDSKGKVVGVATNGLKVILFGERKPLKQVPINEATFNAKLNPEKQRSTDGK